MRDKDDLDKLAEAYNSVPATRIKMRQGIGDWTNDTLKEGIADTVGSWIGKGKQAVQGVAQSARQGVKTSVLLQETDKLKI